MAVCVDQVRGTGELLALTSAGVRPEYLMFWGHRPLQGGGVGRGCLSQWWPADFTIDEITYRSAEQYMMAEKAALFGDTDTARLILQAPIRAPRSGLAGRSASSMSRRGPPGGFRLW